MTQIEKLAQQIEELTKAVRALEAKVGQPTVIYHHHVQHEPIKSAPSIYPNTNPFVTTAVDITAANKRQATAGTTHVVQWNPNIQWSPTVQQ